MKRERVVQVGLVLMGVFYLSWFYQLGDSLWHAKWILEHQEAQTMFVSVNGMLGVFLLLATKQPAQHRLLIAFGAWSSLAHAATMAVQTVEARAHGIPRSPLDVVVIGMAAVFLFAILALLRDAQPSAAPFGAPRFAER